MVWMHMCDILNANVHGIQIPWCIKLMIRAVQSTFISFHMAGRNRLPCHNDWEPPFIACYNRFYSYNTLLRMLFWISAHIGCRNLVLNPNSTLIGLIWYSFQLYIAPEYCILISKCTIVIIHTCTYTVTKQWINHDTRTIAPPKMMDKPKWDVVLHILV